MTEEKDIIDKLKREVLYLRTRNTQKIASDKISFFGLDDKSKKFAVECTISDSSSMQSKCVVVGRPPIADSATKQQRHITPYSFLELIVDKYTTNLSCLNIEEAKEALLQLKASLTTLVSFTQSGLGFKADQYNKFQQFSQTWTKIITELQHDNRDYYLVHKANNSLKQKLNPDELSGAQLLYQDKMKKLFSYTIDELSNDIISCDSVGIINQSLIKLVLILFNTRPNISLPNDKWHTLDYSIRLYDTAKGAKNDTNTGFKTITSDELHSIWHEDPSKLSKKIRVVEDEGALVKATIESLNKISEIIQLLHDNLDRAAAKQIRAYNNFLETRKVLQGYDTELKIESPNVNQKQLISDLVEKQIPCHLYHVFDFKPLEKKVFVPLSTKGVPMSPITVYDKTGEVLYCFMKSKDYRGQLDTKSFRENAEFLAHKVVDHVAVSILAFFNFIDKNLNLQLLKAFSQKIAQQYHFAETEQYAQQYQQHSKNYYKEYDIFNDISLSGDMDSAIVHVSAL